MSRSRWALAGRCLLDDAVRHGSWMRPRLVHRVRSGQPRLNAKGPSTLCLVWLASASLPIMALVPATALAATRNQPIAKTSGQVKQDSQPRDGLPVSTSHSRRVRLVHRHTSSSTPRLMATVLLAEGSGYGSADGSSLVRALQRRLIATGTHPGPVDGRYGPQTERAVQRFQAEHGLLIDGIAGHQTIAALTQRIAPVKPGAGYKVGGSHAVRGLQRDLRRAGSSPGRVDGVYGPLTERAVRRFQAAHGLHVNGVAGPRTLTALGRHGHQPRSHGQQTARRGHAHRRLHRRPSPPRARPRPTRGHPSRRGAPTQFVRPAVRGGASATEWVEVLSALGLGLLAAGWYWRRRPTTPTAASPAAAGTGAAAAVLEHHADRSAPAHEVGAMSAETAYRVDASLGDADAAFRLGVLLEERGDLAGARGAYEAADERGHTGGASNLGVLLAEAGDLAGAAAAYRRADERGDANAAFNLGVMSEQEGDTTGACAAYRRADQRGHAEAAANLGVLLEQMGDVAGAKAAYGRARQRGDANGAVNLGMLLEEHGDLPGARAAYREAVQSHRSEVAQLARKALRELRSDGDGQQGNGARRGRDAS
ncbi:MAG: peptidoglycan-binding protein [Solirubrobacteraceae bacterium]